MNWEAIGAVGEVLGALAVIGTLLYLIVQIKHARKELQYSILQASESADREMQLEMIRNPVLARASDKTNAALGAHVRTREALQSITELSAEEATVLNSYWVGRFTLIAESIRNMEYLDEPRIRNLDRRIVHFFGRGSGQVWFETFQTSGVDMPSIDKKRVVTERRIT